MHVEVNSSSLKASDICVKQGIVQNTILALNHSPKCLPLTETYDLDFKFKLFHTVESEGIYFEKLLHIL